jgi:hypothetical protein
VSLDQPTFFAGFGGTTSFQLHMTVVIPAICLLKSPLGQEWPLMKTVTIKLPSELIQLLGSEEEAKREAKLALVLALVRRG